MANITPLGDSWTQALRRFKALERSLRTNGTFDDITEVMKKYFRMGHAKQIPLKEVDSPCTEVHYLPMHAVYKEDRTTSKLCVVFDASAKSELGTSLNDHLLVGPTVEPFTT